MRDIRISTWVFVLLFFLGEGATMTHLYIMPVPVVGVDSEKFYWSAYYLVKNGSTPLDYMLYVKMLGFFYTMFGVSKFLGAQLSHLAFSFAVVVFIEIGLLLGFDSKDLERGLLLFGTLPSCFLHSAVTMREIFQTAGYLLFVYSFLRLRILGGANVFFPLLASCLWLLFFHKGFAVFLPLAFPSSLLWATRAELRRMIVFGAVVFCILFLFGNTLWSLMLDNSYSLQRIAEGDGLQYIDQYADNVEAGRSDFDVNLKLDSFTSFVSTAPIVFIYYLFSPLPWQVQNGADIVGCMESCVRLILLWRGIRTILKTKGEDRAVLRYLLAIFLLMEATWAAGTSNWGTAVRHRVVAWPVLVLLGLRQNTDEKKQVKQKPTRRQRMRDMRRRHRERLAGDGATG